MARQCLLIERVCCPHPPSSGSGRRRTHQLIAFVMAGQVRAAPPVPVAQQGAAACHHHLLAPRGGVTDAQPHVDPARTTSGVRCTGQHGRKCGPSEIAHRRSTTMQCPPCSNHKPICTATAAGCCRMQRGAATSVLQPMHTSPAEQQHSGTCCPPHAAASAATTATHRRSPPASVPVPTVPAPLL